MALNGTSRHYADVPLRNHTLTHADLISKVAFCCMVSTLCSKKRDIFDDKLK